MAFLKISSWSAPDYVGRLDTCRLSYTFITTIYKIHSNISLLCQIGNMFMYTDYRIFIQASKEAIYAEMPILMRQDWFTDWQTKDKYARNVGNHTIRVKINEIYMKTLRKLMKFWILSGKSCKVNLLFWFVYQKSISSKIIQEGYKWRSFSDLISFLVLFVWEKALRDFSFSRKDHGF